MSDSDTPLGPEKPKTAKKPVKVSGPLSKADADGFDLEEVLHTLENLADGGFVALRITGEPERYGVYVAGGMFFTVYYSSFLSSVESGAKVFDLTPEEYEAL